MIFNERVMYKDRHKIDANDSKQSKFMYVDVDDVPGDPIMKQLVESPQPEEVAGSSGAQ